MELRDRRTLEKELNELKKSYRDILNSNIKLSDELRWIKQDIEREIKKINELDMTKEQIVEDLEKILEANN